MIEAYQLINTPPKLICNTNNYYGILEKYKDGCDLTF